MMETERLRQVCDVNAEGSGLLELFNDMGGSYCLRVDGSFVGLPWDTSPANAKILPLDHWAIPVGMVVAAKVFPALSFLSARSGSWANMCQMCNGEGLSTSVQPILCKECGGLGYTDTLVRHSHRWLARDLTGEWALMVGDSFPSGPAMGDVGPMVAGMAFTQVDPAGRFYRQIVGDITSVVGIPAFHLDARFRDCLVVHVRS